MGKAVHCKSISVILCNKSIAKVGLALDQYIVGDITPSFYDLQKTVYEGTYFLAILGQGMDPPPPSCAPAAKCSLRICIFMIIIIIALFVSLVFPG